MDLVWITFESCVLIIVLGSLYLLYYEGACESTLCTVNNPLFSIKKSYFSLGLNFAVFTRDLYQRKLSPSESCYYIKNGQKYCQISEIKSQ